jgi:hypothetical protein
VTAATVRIPSMPPEEVDRLLAELRAWCREKHGRQKQIVDALGIDKSLLSNWFAGRKHPGLKYYFDLKAFLEKQTGGEPPKSKK